MEFTIKEETTLEYFEAWSGGKDRLDTIIELNIVEEACVYIEQAIGTEFTKTELNDFLWFEMDDFIESFEENIEIEAYIIVSDSSEYWTIDKDEAEKLYKEELLMDENSELYWGKVEHNPKDKDDFTIII